MSMILIFHFYAHGGLKETSYRFIGGLSMYGVDIFVLITGVFSVKLKWKSIFGLALTIVIFELLTILLTVFIEGSLDGITKIQLTKLFLGPISGGRYWFLQVYLILVILSPILNLSLRHIQWQDLRKLVIILSFIEFYSCNFINNVVDQVGHSLFNFIYLYILGYFIVKDDYIAKIKDKFLIIIIVTCVIIEVVWLYKPIRFFYLLSDSSITTVLTSVSIILLLYRHPFHSKMINSISGCALGAYLIQDGFLGFNVIYDYQISFINNNDMGGYFLLAGALFLGYWIGAWVLMHLINLFVPAISSFLENKVPKCFQLENIH